MTFIEVDSLRASFMRVDDFSMVKTQQVKNRSVDIVDVGNIFCGEKAEFVGGAN